MKKILFVDDETKVLEALRRMLRPLRLEWDMEFVDGGQKALDRMAENPCDVVVTDMRMPGMDGAQLLTAVMQQYPATVRIILSGQCDRDTVLKAVRPAHQFLTKPCDSATLKATVARACQLRDRLADQGNRQMVSRVTSLCSPPASCAALLAELAAPRPSIERVAEIIAQDVGMTGKVMQLVSSGFFGTPQTVFNPRQAVTLLGLDSLRALAQVGIFAAANDDVRDSLERMEEHSRTVAAAALAITLLETGDSRRGNEAYLAGLLHDVGGVILAQESRDRYRELLIACRQTSLPVWEVEQRSYGASHAEMGAYLMALWGLPDSVVQTIMYHHCPLLAGQTEFTPLTAVHAAEALTVEEGLNVFLPLPPVDIEYLDRIGCAGRVAAWRKTCRSAILEGACV